jgi:tRNA(Ile)-lysidine synthase
MSDLLKKYRSFIGQHKLFNKDQKLLVAVSGGLDSSVLLHLTISAGYHVEIAHCNFKLRDDESERDQNFVKSLASDYGVPLHLRSFETQSYANQNHISIQEAARELRYAWFQELLADNNLDRALTAHHADDNAETVVMNLFKGTGIAGLKGILPLTGRICRPLLFASRKDLEAYASNHGISHVEDSSNMADKYSRNFFRLNIIPLVEQLYPGTQENLRNNLPRFREAELIYREAVERKLRKLKKQSGDEIHIPVELLRYTVPLQTMIFELFHPYGFSPGQIPEIEKLMDSETGRFMKSSTHLILKNRNWFILSPLHTPFPSVITIEEGVREVGFPGGILELKVENAEKDPGTDPITACIDAREVQYPIMLRPWKAGDYFYPLGMQKKKKIARFLIDQKLSRTAKEKVWVIESSRRIIWVVGMRIDDRVKIESATRQMVRITWKPAV